MKKIKRIWLYCLSIQAALLLIANSCSKDELAVLTTASPSDIEVTNAISGGTITSDSGTPVSVRGVCWSTAKAPTIANSKTEDGAGTGSFTSSITGLAANTTYYVRAYATNGGGTVYGNESSFMTFGVIDIDGNKYHSLVIGTQEWMLGNLKTTSFSDGSEIPSITSGTDWANLTTGATAVYNNDLNNAAIYGQLYNWFAVTDIRQLSPVGWHIPTNDEWDVLATTLEGAEVAGGKMKTTGTFQPGEGLWYSPNTGATNSSGFNGLPGGHFGDNGIDVSQPFHFGDIHSYGNWWTADGKNGGATFRFLQDTHTILETSQNSQKTGKSVRCVKD